MAYTTGNEIRDQFLRRAIGEVIALGEKPTLEAVGAHLPGDEGAFELDPSELVGMLNDMKVDIRPPVIPPKRVPPPPAKPEPYGPITGYVDPALFAVSPETHEKIDTPQAAESEQPSLDTADATPEPDSAPVREYVIDAPATAEGYQRVKAGIVEAEARHQLDIANARLGKAKELLYAARVDLRRKREALGSAAHDYQMLADSATDGLPLALRQQIEIRNHLASTAAERAKNPHRKNANAFVFSRMRNSPNRGAYNRSAAARAGYRNFDPARGPVAKLPSEQ